MKFNEQQHTYRLNGDSYVSATKFIETFKKPFEKEKVAERMASKSGRDKDKILLEWKLKGGIARNYGDAIHKSIELWIKFGEKPNHSYLQDVVNKFDKKYDRENLFSEITVFDEERKIAGKTDVLKKVDGGIELIDIKTNGEITDKSYNNFLPPLDKLPQSKLNEYRLQQSLYKHMIELRGIKVKEIKLEHWSNNFKTIKIKPIKLDKIL